MMKICNPPLEKEEDSTPPFGKGRWGGILRCFFLINFRFIEE
jgi:hypothetical protein